MSDVASSLAWCSIGIVDGDRKLRMEAMVQQDSCTERCDVGIIDLLTDGKVDVFVFEFT